MIIPSSSQIAAQAEGYRSIKAKMQARLGIEPDFKKATLGSTAYLALEKPEKVYCYRLTAFAGEALAKMEEFEAMLREECRSAACTASTEGWIWSEESVRVANERYALKQLAKADAKEAAARNEYEMAMIQVAIMHISEMAMANTAMAQAMTAITKHGSIEAYLEANRGEPVQSHEILSWAQALLNENKAEQESKSAQANEAMKTNQQIEAVFSDPVFLALQAELRRDANAGPSSATVALPWGGRVSLPDNALLGRFEAWLDDNRNDPNFAEHRQAYHALIERYASIDPRQIWKAILRVDGPKKSTLIRRMANVWTQLGVSAREWMHKHGKRHERHERDAVLALN